MTLSHGQASAAKAAVTISPPVDGMWLVRVDAEMAAGSTRIRQITEIFIQKCAAPTGRVWSFLQPVRW